MMVVLTQLVIENFKRFRGVHTLPLAGDGAITVIAAENGVGKTTVLDALYLALHGKKGIQMRKNDASFDFDAWLKNAYSSTAEWTSGYGKLGVRLQMDTMEGPVTVERQFWLEEETENHTEETNLYIGDELLRLEKGEDRHQTIKSWIEALFPLAITQRFLVDGEQLGTLDVRNLGVQIRDGLDDVLGQGTLHRLKYHLAAVKRKTIATLAPAHERESLEQLLADREERSQTLLELQRTIETLEGELGALDEERGDLRKKLEMTSSEEGSALGKLRIAFAQSNSELAQARKQAVAWLVEDLPFLVNAEALNLEHLQHTKAVETMRSARLRSEVVHLLQSTLDNVKPSLPATTKEAIQAQATAELNASEGSLPPAFRFLNSDLMEAFTLQHAIHVKDKQPVVQGFFEEAVGTLERHRSHATALQTAAQQSGMAETASQLEAVSAKIGRVEAALAHRKSEMATLQTLQQHDDERIDSLQASASVDSKQQRIIGLIDAMMPVLDRYADDRRDQLAQPLSEAFEKGFELLSRKAKRIKHIGVNPQTYEVDIGMAGFSGNWLDRDLSATEKQHVGLSLLYALRHQAQSALPVVVDTPTSRMDKRHKGYSVTKFYPKLSHQVIVLATSDDLAGGLYSELKAAKALGCELLLKESDDAEVVVETGSLSTFFEVES
jgi:DNA sulfur modification protein DndD